MDRRNDNKKILFWNQAVFQMLPAEDQCLLTRIYQANMLKNPTENKCRFSGEYLEISGNFVWGFTA